MSLLVNKRASTDLTQSETLFEAALISSHIERLPPP